MTDRKPKKSRRSGVWERLEVIEDPDSRIGLVLSERIRGKVAYSMQITHVDDMGPNRHVPMSPEGAKHALKDIVYSLVQRAEEIVAERKKAHLKNKKKQG